jgi:hypothetical protein
MAPVKLINGRLHTLAPVGLQHHRLTPPLRI